MLDPEHLLASSWGQAQRNIVEILKVPDVCSSGNDPAPGGCPADREEARAGDTPPPPGPPPHRPHCRAEAGWLESKLSSGGRFNFESITLGPVLLAGRSLSRPRLAGLCSVPCALGVLTGAWRQQEVTALRLFAKEQKIAFLRKDGKISSVPTGSNCFAFGLKC